MDFTLTDEQSAVRDLAAQILSERSTPERVREVESDPDGDWFDRALWNELAKADLLGLCLPEADGGVGLRRQASAADSGCSSSP